MEEKKDQYKIAVLGAGSWGITLSNVLNDNGNKVILWEFNPEQEKKLRKTRRFVSLKGYKIPKEIKITNSLEEAIKDADYIVVSVPSCAIESLAEKLTEVKIRRGLTIISTVKGFGSKSFLRPSQVLRKYIGNKVHIAVLSGPSHAEEVIKKVPTAVVVSSRKIGTRREVQKLFSNIYFRLYTSPDVVGVELGGALKNIIAIASGISNGMGMGDNTKAALITRGNAEIIRLGTRLGGRKVTFNGLSGIGDLIVTCFSEHSRNFRYGKLLGRGLSPELALDKIATTVEGVGTAKICHELARKKKVQMPVCEKVYQIIYKSKKAKKAWKELMKRPLKSEEERFN